MENANQSIKNRADEVFIGNYLRYPTAMVSGAGCELIDADGNRYLDFLSGIAVCALGDRSSRRRVTPAASQVRWIGTQIALIIKSLTAVSAARLWGQKAKPEKKAVLTA